MRTWQIYVFAFGVFSIINAEMGVVGILPALAEHYEVSISTAGLTVSLFALAIVFAGPTMPLLASRFPRRWAMSTVLVVFTVGSLIAAFTTNFAVLLATRILSGIFQPVYTSMAFSLAAEATDDPTKTPRVVAKLLWEYLLAWFWASPLPVPLWIPLRYRWGCCFLQLVMPWL